MLVYAGVVLAIVGVFGGAIWALVATFKFGWTGAAEEIGPAKYEEGHSAGVSQAQASHLEDVKVYAKRLEAAYRSGYNAGREDVMVLAAVKETKSLASGGGQ